MYDWRGRIGLILSSTNTVAEIEIRKMLPEGVETFSARYLKPEYQNEMERDNFYGDLDKIKLCLIKAAKEISSIEPDLIVWPCTLGSLLSGEGTDLKLAQMIKQNTGYEAITTTTAVIEYIKHLNLKKMIMVTPYPELHTRIEKEYIEKRIKNLSIDHYYSRSVFEKYNRKQLSPESIYKIIKSLALCHEGYDGLFISCTDFPSLEIIKYLENDLNCKVVTSNLATAWFILQKIKVSDENLLKLVDRT